MTDTLNGFGLGGLHLLSNARTRSISAENTDGAKGGGARATPEEVLAKEDWFGTREHPASELGKGWKIRPCITLGVGEEVTLADIEGPGVIQHIWITVHWDALRSCILRMWWDDEETPSVEVPLGDFFAVTHGKRHDVNSLPVSVNPDGGMNCYWPMPFRKRARISITNEFFKPIGGFFYQITYALDDVPENAAYLHAQWRRSTTQRDYPEHVLLDGVRGKGHYVGTVLSWSQFSDGWWGEGEIKFYMDGDEADPTICGTGTEDYFGGAWGFEREGRTCTFSTPFLGYPFYHFKAGEVPKHGLYRWHIMDPIRFDSDLRVTIQALGWWPGGKFEPLADDIASVAYWYQSEPHAPFPPMPPREQRWPR
ncbi:MAG: DUF2961 domain-containing protein [Anaerolineae bacterium]|nr:DUF2961 domain-containing protein [Anaerolineae bacterium]